MFLFKIATFTYKVINEKDNLPSVYSDFISLASSCHAICIKTKLLVQTMENSHSSLYLQKESIDNSIKQSITVNIFKKRYKNFLLT
jgi:hypothetical protein